MKKILLRECHRIALQKMDGHPQHDNYMHYTFIVQENKILEYAMNTPSEPPKHLGYHERIRNGSPKAHSEFNAFRRAKGLLNQQKSFDCINIRLNKKGDLRMSAPCVCCTNFLSSFGCRDCFFTTEEGWAKVVLYK